MCDPRTNGGLPIAASPDVADLVRAAGFAQAAAIGTMAVGPARIEVVA